MFAARCLMLAAVAAACALFSTSSNANADEAGAGPIGTDDPDAHPAPESSVGPHDAMSLMSDQDLNDVSSVFSKDDLNPGEAPRRRARRRVAASARRYLVLFNASIEDNIAYGRPGASRAELEAAAAGAQVWGSRERASASRRARPPGAHSRRPSLCRCSRWWRAARSSCTDAGAPSEPIKQPSPAPWRACDTGVRVSPARIHLAAPAPLRISSKAAPNLPLARSVSSRSTSAGVSGTSGH